MKIADLKMTIKGEVIGDTTPLYMIKKNVQE